MSTASACAVLAVLELDATLFAQTMASRPLVVGAVLGWMTGQAQAGMLFGAAFELLSLCDLPVGGSLTWSAPVAAGAATMLAGRGTSFSLCFLGGLTAGILHSRAEAVERSRRAATGDALVRRAEAGGRILAWAFGSSLVLHAAMTFTLAGAVVAVVSAADRYWWPNAPSVLWGGAALVAASAPWIGLSGVAARGLRRS